MSFTIKTAQREDDGRWIAEIPQFSGAMAYGDDQEDAINKAKDLALQFAIRDLAVVRETNQRLNRRCQNLESELVKRYSSAAIAATELQAHVERARQYANELRDIYRSKKHSIHAFYEKHWQRLPKSVGLIDGIEARIDETLRLLGERSQ